MAKHEANDRRASDALSDHAARSSALLQARNNARAASQVPSGATNSSARPRSGTSEEPAQSRKAAQRPEQRGRMARDKRPMGILGWVQRNIVYIAAVIAVIAVVTLGLGALRLIMPGVADVQLGAATASVQAAYVSPYDWSKLDRSSDRYAYVVNGQVKSRLGIDVSESQGEIDWQAVAEDGIDFAMVRIGYRGATEGGLYADSEYRANIEDISAVGLDCGVYFFSQAVSVAEAREEADFVLSLLEGVKLEYPVAFDSEKLVLSSGQSRTSGLSSEEMTAIADAFCKRIEEAGYRAIVYGNAYDLERYDRALLAQRSVWWAEYGARAATANMDIDMWQYSNSGRVAGVSTNVDLNLDLTPVLS